MATKKELIIKVVKDIASKYGLGKLTLRQIYYRIMELSKSIPELDFPNTTSQYKSLSKILVDARKDGTIPYNVMEDRTREVIDDTWTYYDNWKDTVNSQIENIKNAPEIEIHKNLYQDKINLIVLEKQALEGIFTRTLSNMSILVVCKGYNSLSQLKDLYDILEDEKRQVNCYFFSDFDPSGIDIQRNFKEQMELDFNIKFDKFERKCLTEKQIAQYNLPFAPVKTKDTRSKGWKPKGVIEMDALEPNILVNLISECVDENWNNKTDFYRIKLETVLNRRAKKLYAKKLKEMVKELSETD